LVSSVSCTVAEKALRHVKVEELEAADRDAEQPSALSSALAMASVISVRLKKKSKAVY
jgi:hypothetical protein